MGRHPREIVEQYTVGQVKLLYQNIRRIEFDQAEITARLVWSVASGWKRPKVTKLEDAMTMLKKKGMFVEQ